jgi:RNA polymerase sigma factor (sigma-70 family)
MSCTEDNLHLLSTNPVLLRKARQTRQGVEAYLSLGYLALVRACARFNEKKGSLQSYLNTAIRNAIIDEDRAYYHLGTKVKVFNFSDQAARHGKDFDAGEGSESDSTNSSFGDPPAPEKAPRLDAADLGAAALTAIENLTPPLGVMLLARIGGASYEALSRDFSIPIGTVKSRLSTARRHLRTLLLDTP